MENKFIVIHCHSFKKFYYCIAYVYRRNLMGIHHLPLIEGGVGFLAQNFQSVTIYIKSKLFHKLFYALHWPNKTTWHDFLMTIKVAAGNNDPEGWQHDIVLSFDLKHIKCGGGLGGGGVIFFLRFMLFPTFLEKINSGNKKQNVFFCLEKQ